MTVFNRYFYGDGKGKKLKRRAAAASLTVAGLLVAAKMATYLQTNSVSLLSSLMDSIFDAMASLVILVSITRASVPADEDHRYGHGKIEALGALTQALFILGSSLFLLIEAVRRFTDPETIDHPAMAIGVMILSIVLTLALVFYQKYVIRRTKSVAIKADSLHYTGDLWMNLSVIAALALGYYTGWPYFDPLFALGIALRLLKGAWDVSRHSFDILLDRELSDEDRRKIESIVTSHSDVCGMHDLRTRNTGDRIFIEFHMEVDADATIKRVHDIMDEVEEMLFKAYPQSEVLTHPEPEGLHDFRLDHAVKNDIKA